MEKQEKVTFIHSIAFKVTLLVVLASMFCICVNVINAERKADKAVGNISNNYVLSMAITSAQTIDGIPQEQINAETYAHLLSAVKMEGVDSSYAYLVDADGMLLYHPAADKIGKPIENEQIMNVVSKLQSGGSVEDGIVEYKIDGSDKCEGYAVTGAKQVVVVTVDKDEIMEPVDSMVSSMLTLSLVSTIICIIISLIVSRLICTPIERLTVIITNTAQFNFRKNPYSAVLCKRKDESGKMAREIRLMRKQLREMVRDIEDAGSQITENVKGLQSITNTVDSMCSDNSATSQELAAGMQQTAATTVTINENVGMLKDGTEGINTMASDGARTSEEIMERAENLRTKTVEASSKTMDMYESVKVKADQAIEGSKAVEKINALTQTIMEISSQTSLLALNASIEAARAGDAGRGFAVVATEIGGLADQTTQAVANINDIITEVHHAVTNMANCLEETTVFLEDTVIKEYKGFEKVSEQYQQDANIFRSSMDSVKAAVEDLVKSIEAIAGAMNGINDTVGESSCGIVEIAEKTSNMVEKTSSTHNMVNDCFESVEHLQGIVQKFVLE